MIYKARVIDTSMFPTTGTIRIRIFSKTYKEKDRGDLSKYPETISEFSEPIIVNNNLKIEDHDQRAYLSTAFGGGIDYGVFYLPQVNSVGIVSSLGDTTNPDNNGQYVWLGNIYDYTQEVMATGSNGMKEIIEPPNVNIPSDNEFENVNGIEYNGYQGKESESFIMKFKSTILGNPLNPEASAQTMDWKQRPLENMIIINKNKVSLLHNILENDIIEGTEEIVLEKNNLKIERNVKNTVTTFDIDQEGKFNISRVEETEDKKKSISIATTSSLSLDLTVSNSDSNDDSNSAMTTISQTDKEINLSTSGVNATIAENNARINATKDGEGTVTIYANKVVLGNGGEHPVLYANGGDPPEGTAASDRVFV